MVNLILFPASFFSIKKVDEDLQKEYDAVIKTGLFDVILFGYDKWINEGVLTLNKKPEKMQKTIMRGWMMKPEIYKKFYDNLLLNNIELITTPKEYEQMHVFPNVYNQFGNDTASIKIYPFHEQIDVNELKSNFSRFMVKDFVKSVKGTEFPKYFNNSITQEEFDKYMKIFYKYRGDLLTGGICIKEYLDLKFYNDKTNEYRVFYLKNEIVSISKNSAQPEYAMTPPKELIEKYKNLPSCYYTIDFAELMDGSWKIIEAGDGSVSGLSEKQNEEQYFRALYHVLN